MKKKISFILLAGLRSWQAVNVVGHLAISIGRYADQDIMGKNPILDADGLAHMGIAKFPVVALKAANQTEVRAVLEAARRTDRLLVADYPRQMLDTYSDEDLCAAMASAPESQLEYLGLAILGSAEAVRRLTGHLKLWN